MTNKILSYSSFGISVLTLILVGVLVFGGSPTLRNLGAEGDTNFTNLVLSGYATVTGQATVAGLVNSSGTTIGGGTLITKYNCVNATWNPGSVASSGNALAYGNATSVVLSSANAFVLGKPIIVGLTTATATTAFSLKANVQTTGSSTVWLENWDSSALDLATGTVSVCQVQ